MSAKLVPEHLCLGLRFITVKSIHTELLRILGFQAKICYWLEKNVIIIGIVPREN